jgi:hypothetical protein
MKFVGLAMIGAAALAGSREEREAHGSALFLLVIIKELNRVLYASESCEAKLKALRSATKLHGELGGKIWYFMVDSERSRNFALGAGGRAFDESRIIVEDMEIAYRKACGR